MESKSLNKTFIGKEESSDDEKELMKEGGKLVSKEKKIVSPRSSLNNRETELVVNSLVMKIELLVKKHHKVFNPIAQASLYYLKQKPNGEMLGKLFLKRYKLQLKWKICAIHLFFILLTYHTVWYK